MFFDELSNDEWARLAALVSDEPAVRLNRRGRPRAEPRVVANAVLWILTTGEPWSKLPGRYPSGPTCRRRFEEWQANGTLIEMVRLLSETGRTFAYIPEAAPPVASKPAPEVEPPKPRDDTMRGVFWKSPESWQSAPGSIGATGGWRPLGAMADITRQLAGMVEAESVSHEALGVHDDTFTVHGVREPRTAPETFDAHTRHAAAEARVAGTEMSNEPRIEPDVEPQGEPDSARAIASPTTDAADARELPPHDAPNAGADERARDDHHAPLWMNLAAPGGAKFEDARGYMIYVMAEPVASGCYRAWAEVMKDDRRVERSGLIGPRFDDAEAARRYALQWAMEWIDRACAAHGEVTFEADAAAPASADLYSAGAAAVAVAAAAAAPETPWPLPPAPVSRPMPDSAAAKSSLPAAARIGTANVPSSGGAAAAASYPQHPNAHRVQLRRYPSDNADSNGKPAERFPELRKLLSHMR
jgi:transposase